MEVVTVAQMTAEEYLALPEQRWTNLVEGEVVVAEPRIEHQRTAGDLYLALRLWTAQRSGHGEVTLTIDVSLDEVNVYAPDVLWYSETRRPRRGVRPQALPDLAIEVRSPTTWRYDIGAKKAAYERYGLPELWLVDTDASVVLIFRRSGASAPAFDASLELASGDALASPLLPGFTLALDDLFADR
jgi:Uma2 family endonuclease